MNELKIMTKNYYYEMYFKDIFKDSKRPIYIEENEFDSNKLLGFYRKQIKKKQNYKKE